MLPKMMLSGVAMIGLTGFASAADLYVKGPPVYAPTWTGCYLGGHAGYGITTSTSQYSSPTLTQLAGLGFQPQYQDSFNNKGFAGGGQGGCQLQTGAFLWGLEGDWSSFSNSASRNFQKAFSFETNNDQSLSYSSLWSARGRVGGIFSDVYYLYVTAGIGGAKANYTSLATYSQPGDPSGAISVSSANAVGMSPTGIVFGAGAEWKLWPQFVIGVEYLHYALTSDAALPLKQGLYFGPAVGPGAGDHVHTNGVDVARVRASYLFNWWGR
jgi:outer membrane immunogenic protein